MQKEVNEEKLINARHSIGLYSIKELCAMFGCSRYSIDFAINSNGLKYISPNNKSRFIYLNDFLAYTQKQADKGVNLFEKKESDCEY